MEMLVVRSMAARLPVAQSGVIINLVQPGLCTTELDRNASWSKWMEIKIMRAMAGRTAEQGSRTLLHAAVVGEESHGSLASDCELKRLVTLPLILCFIGRRRD